MKWLLAFLLLPSAQAAEIHGRPLPTVAPLTLQPQRLQAPVEWQPGMPIREVPRQSRPGGDKRAATAGAGQALPLRAGQGGASVQMLFNADGEGFSGVNPPDPVLAAGARQVVQMINDYSGSTVRVLDRNQPAQGPVMRFTLGSLATGSGSNCATDGYGDPIAHYDRLAHRWLLSEFTPASWCLYVSATEDLTSTVWQVYEFVSQDGGFPDYPKFIQWGDGYYLTTNEGGPYIYAFNRADILAGQPVTPQVFTGVPPLSGFSFNALQGVNQTGFTQPAGPALFLRHVDDEAHEATPDPAADFLELWSLSMDWATAGNSVLQGPARLAISEFDSDLCGLTTFQCLQQPGTATRLDPLREVVMWPASWRQLADGSQHIVAAFATDADGSDRAATRWLELTPAGSGWALVQEGVNDLADGIHRWMGSVAMDESGRLALIYNRVDNSSVYPGLAVMARAPGDAAGVLGAEQVLVDGQAANGSFRYGDYNSLVVDPQDGCRYWGTGEYNPAANWRTRIFSFRVSGCEEGAVFQDGFEGARTGVVFADGFE